MSYRIKVNPDAGGVLRTLESHIVLRLGRALADLAVALDDGAELESEELRVGDWRLRLSVDRAGRLLEIAQVEHAPVFAAAGVAV